MVQICVVQIWHRLFTHFLMIACINACVLYNLRTRNDKLTLLEIIKALIIELREESKSAEIYPDGYEPPPVAPQPPAQKITRGQYKTRRSFRENAGIFEEAITHCPKKVADNKHREGCVVCGTRSGFKCMGCDAFVCIGITDCWQKMHNIGRENLVKRRKK